MDKISTNATISNQYFKFKFLEFEYTHFTYSLTGTTVCLCNDKISLLKWSNIKRHFDTHHTTFALKYPVGDSWKKACQELLKSASQSALCWFFSNLPKHSCLMWLMNSLMTLRIKSMPLSARTVHDRTIMMANQVEEKQVYCPHKCSDLFLDESTAVSHLSQFSVIARYAASDTLREESLAMLPINASTRGEDLFRSFMEFAKEKKNLQMDKLISERINGVVCIVGKNRGFVALLCENEHRPILGFHCILYQEVLCAQLCDMQLGEVMSLVIHIANFIVARALNHRQFKTLLDEFGSNYKGRCLAILDIELPKLANTKSLLKFYYLVDMTEHLNQLNVKMQGIGNTVLTLQQAVFEFENKLELFIASDIWVNKFKSLKEDLERLIPQRYHTLLFLTIFS
uniref:Uncharacterized protein n=1 Tax=Periophthalmus magnuspinnatus TaxID=409849 RepID=A0A3B4BD55_9GOBI